MTAIEVELNRCWVNVYGRSLNFQNGVISSNIFNIGLYRGLLAKRVIRHVKDAITITASITDGLASMPEVIIRLGCFASRRLSNLRLKF